jgi:hypothetical protein
MGGGGEVSSGLCISNCAGPSLTEGQSVLAMCKAHRSVGQVKERVQEPRNKGLSLMAIHCLQLKPSITPLPPAAGWLSCLPAGSFLFLACPRSTWWLSFQSHFLLRLLMHNKHGGPPVPSGQMFECCEASLILDSSEVSSLWQVQKCNLGMILTDPKKLPIAKWGGLKS